MGCKRSLVDINEIRAVPTKMTFRLEFVFARVEGEIKHVLPTPTDLDIDMFNHKETLSGTVGRLQALTVGQLAGSIINLPPVRKLELTRFELSVMTKEANLLGEGAMWDGPKEYALSTGMLDQGLRSSSDSESRFTSAIDRTLCQFGAFASPAFQFKSGDVFSVKLHAKAHDNTLDSVFVRDEIDEAFDAPPPIAPPPPPPPAQAKARRRWGSLRRKHHSSGGLNPGKNSKPKKLNKGSSLRRIVSWMGGKGGKKR